MKQPARRQGRQPGRDVEPRPAGAAGLHHHHRGLHLLLSPTARPIPPGWRPRSQTALAAVEKAGRPQVRRCRQSAAGLGALRRARLDARHDGHGAQSRPQRPTVAGLAQDRRATSASPMTAIAASSRCTANVVLGVEHHHFEEAAGAAQGGSRRQPRHRARGRRLAAAGRAPTRKIVEKQHRQALPAGAARAALGRDRRGVRLAG